jgi:hypothetical protein
MSGAQTGVEISTSQNKKATGKYFLFAQLKHARQVKKR